MRIRIGRWTIYHKYCMYGIGVDRYLLDIPTFTYSISNHTSYNNNSGSVCIFYLWCRFSKLRCDLDWLSWRVMSRGLREKGAKTISTPRHDITYHSISFSVWYHMVYS